MIKSYLGGVGCKRKLTPPRPGRFVLESLIMSRLALILACVLLVAADEPKKPTTAPVKATEPWEKITEKDIASITYEDAEVDSGFVTPRARAAMSSTDIAASANSRSAPASA